MNLPPFGFVRQDVMNNALAMYNAGRADAVFQSNLVQRRPLLNGQKTLEFDLVAKNNTPAVTERLLDFNDRFDAYAIGFYLVSESLAAPGDGRMYTHAGQVFADRATAGSYTQAAVEQVYRGFWDLTLNSTVMAEGNHMQNHKYVSELAEGTPTTSFGYVNNTPADDEVISLAPYEPTDLAKGVMPFQPVVELYGQNRIRLTVEYPQTADTEDAGGTYQNYLYVKLFGILLKGVNNA